MTTRLVLLALFLSTPLFAQHDSTMIPRSLFYAEPTRRAVQLHPNGLHVGYLSTAGRGVQLHCLSAADGWKNAAIADTAPVLDWRWTYQANTALVVTPGSDGDRLLTLDVTNGKKKEITTVKGARLHLIATSAQLPGKTVVLADAGESDQTGLYTVDLENNTSPVRIAGADQVQEWYFDAQLHLRAGRRFTNEGTELLRLTSTGVWERIARYEGLEEYQVPGVVSLSADGQRLYIVDNQGRDKGSLVAIDLADGSRRELFADSLADLLFAGATIDSDGTIQAVVSYFPAMRRHFLDTSIASDFALLQGTHDGDVSFVSQSLNGQTWLIRYLDGGPLDYYVYDRLHRKPVFLFNEMPELADHALAHRYPALVTARDGLRLPCDIYLPPGSDANNDGIPDTPLPTIVYVHGGPWAGFQRNLWLTNRHFQLLANRGYAVIRADFRGTSGYGRAFLNAGDLQWGEGMMHDIMDITSWAVKQGIADEDHLGIWGWSYGGYAAFAALAFWPDIYACGISMYGVSDVYDAVASRVERDGVDVWSEWLKRVGDIRTTKGQQLLRNQSPLNSVAQIHQPLLVTHGALDRIVEQRQSDTIVQRLRELNRPVTYFIYSNEGHDYRRPENWESFWAIAERFLHEHLGGRYEPYGDDIAQSSVKMITGAEHIPGLERTLRDVN